ncbi:hypothetical protein CHARACLAT_032208 [Characodon lateralis]|uniref:Uncharacterized protein n=1 Tax=Characodon lateralis TaxID=208331 RepID=A0ABU7CVC5_9TELE|nr:hypothetical protein [Characodon lateralis]
MLLSLAQPSDHFTHLFLQYFFALPQRSSSFHDQLIANDPVSVATSMILAKHLLDQAFHACSFACLLVPPRLASCLLVGLLFSASSVYEPILKTIAVENIKIGEKLYLLFPGSN